MYANNVDCSYTIQVSSGSVVKLDWIDFDIEYDVKCGYDYVTIYDVDNTGKLITSPKFCGSTKPNLQYFQANKIIVSLNSDASITGRGFKLKYSTGMKYYHNITNYHFYIEDYNDI